MSDSLIRIVIIEPGFDPEVRLIKNDLKSLQELVGGYIEVLPFYEHLIIIINEEGKIIGLPHSGYSYRGDSLVGPIVILGTEGEEFISLTKEEAEKTLEYWRNM